MRYDLNFRYKKILRFLTSANVNKYQFDKDIFYDELFPFSGTGMKSLKCQLLAPHRFLLLRKPYEVMHILVQTSTKLR